MLLENNRINKIEVILYLNAIIFIFHNYLTSHYNPLYEKVYYNFLIILIIIMFSIYYFSKPSMMGSNEERIKRIFFIYYFNILFSSTLILIGIIRLIERITWTKLNFLVVFWIFMSVYGILVFIFSYKLTNVIDSDPILNFDENYAGFGYPMPYIILIFAIRFTSLKNSNLENEWLSVLPSWILTTIIVFLLILYIRYIQKCKNIEVQNNTQNIHNQCIIYDKDIIYQRSFLPKVYFFILEVLGIFIFWRQTYRTDNAQPLLRLISILFIIFGIFIIINYFLIIKKVKGDELTSRYLESKQLIYFGIFYSTITLFKVLSKTLTGTVDRYFFINLILFILFIIFTIFIKSEVTRIINLQSTDDNTEEQEKNILFQLGLLGKSYPYHLVIIYISFVLIIEL